MQLLLFERKCLPIIENADVEKAEENANLSTFILNEYQTSAALLIRSIFRVQNLISELGNMVMNTYKK